jgi:hypothetical protein
MLGAGKRKLLRSVTGISISGYETKWCEDVRKIKIVPQNK